MRYFFLAVSLTLVLLVACTRTAVDAPRLDHGPKAAEEYRLDLGPGVVVTFDEGPSSGAPGSGIKNKVAYVTHVPSGSQMVIGREGQVISRHDGRGDGPAQLDAVLGDEEIMGDIIAGVNAEDLPFPQHADWINFVKFEGITYMANRGQGLAKNSRVTVSVDDLGVERYRIAFRLRDFAGFGYRSQDGDAAYLAPGTAIFELKRYATKFRLAAVVDGAVTVFEADTNPEARTGADLLDIRDRVRSIGINSPEDATTVLATIDDPETVERLVEIVLSAPVAQGRRDHEGERYFIAFHLEDGTAVTRAYWLDSGELSRGIMTAPPFRASVMQTLAQEPGLAREPQTSQPAGVTASCVARFSPETVRERAFAFDGTVRSVEMRVDPKLPIEEGQSPDMAWVTFGVNRWFNGGESPEVAIWVDPHTPRGVWPVEPGDRLLAAGEYRWGQPPEDPLAWGCGFTQTYTPEAAAQWADAMPVPTSAHPLLAIPAGCSDRDDVPPCGPGVEMGKSYPYTQYTHCGIRGAYFDGRRWIAAPVLGDNNPPPGWGNPFDAGAMELAAEDLARFTSGAGMVAEFRPLPEEAEYPWGLCY